MKNRVLIVSEVIGTSPYYKPFSKFGLESSQSQLLWTEPESIRLVVFTGGADVSPSLYGEEAAYQTSCVPKRDIFESIVFRKALSLKIPMAGICRGAQFLNVMAGGKIVQHITGHAINGHHDLTTSAIRHKSRTFPVTSTHHQMILCPENAELVAWSSSRKSDCYLGPMSKPIYPKPDKETEVVYWPTIMAVGMQYHPEAMYEESACFKYAKYLVESYLELMPV
jgi:gamma-glutamyl-gamma-aminobutyrate hydrolase PuuD